MSRAGHLPEEPLKAGKVINGDFFLRWRDLPSRSSRGWTLDTPAEEPHCGTRKFKLGLRLEDSLAKIGLTRWATPGPAGKLDFGIF
jgi:hypothetical protein